MRIILEPPVSASDVKKAINLLLAANIVAQSGALVRQGGDVTSGVILLLRDKDSEEAIGVLAEAGIRARI